MNNIAPTPGLTQEILYVWRGDHVETYVLGPYKDHINDTYNCLLVDCRYDENNPVHRYGKYEEHFTKTESSSWIHIPFEDFPKEFKGHLLLLGIKE
jgi:hypothetical protein